MRLVNALFRGGHLSERELAEICVTGERPMHLDRCDVCAERAVELSRWLDDIRVASLAEADASFPSERLAAQQSQIMRRLEQLDQPARVIAFPNHPRTAERPNGRRVAPAWVGVAAAAGLVLGVIGGQVSARLAGKPAPVAAPAATATNASVDPNSMAKLQQIDQEELDNGSVGAVEAVNLMTPKVITGGVTPASYSVPNGGR